MDGARGVSCMARDVTGSHFHVFNSASERRHTKDRRGNPRDSGSVGRRQTDDRRIAETNGGGIKGLARRNKGASAVNLIASFWHALTGKQEKAAGGNLHNSAQWSLAEMDKLLEEARQNRKRAEADLERVRERELAALDAIEKAARNLTGRD